MRSGRTSPTSCSTSARFAAAYAELEEIAYDGCALSVVITPVEGLVIESDEVALGDGLSLARATTLADAPHGLPDDPHATVAVLALESKDGRALEQAGKRLRRLQTALRLWDDAEPALGPAAHARTDGADVDGHPARHRHPPPERGLPAELPRRRTRCARSAASSPAARRGPGSWPGRCGASSSAASAAARSRR